MHRVRAKDLECLAEEGGALGAACKRQIQCRSTGIDERARRGHRERHRDRCQCAWGGPQSPEPDTPRSGLGATRHANHIICDDGDVMPAGMKRVGNVLRMHGHTADAAASEGPA